MKYTSHFVKKEEVAEQTFECFFSKPDGFNYQAGQFISLCLDEVIYEFTLVSCPSNEYLSIATRLRSTKFKQRLHSLSPADVVEVEGPFGQFVLDAQHKLNVFIAGGIGVTPFISMIRSGVKDAVLFYSFRSRGDALYLNNLFDSEIGVVPTITRERDVTNWTGGYGRLSSELLRTKLSADQLQSGLFYLSGSPSFVNDMMELIIDLEVDEERIRIDSFAGY